MAIAAILLFAGASVHAGITKELVLDNLTLPIYATAPPGDTRLFLAGQRGTIHIIENDTLRADPFLDIDSLVHFTGIFNSEGFYGLAFHPDYATNGYFERPRRQRECSPGWCLLPPIRKQRANRDTPRHASSLTPG